VNDFDFFVGSWDVANRRLRRCLVDGDDQEEFPATSECVRLFGGAANMDEISMPDKGYRGLTLRLFDPVRQLWSLYWVSSRDGALQPPVVGRFADGVGLFFGDDTYEGKDVRVRYTWSDITPTSARWAQAFSVDGERTWETNWTMEFTRRG
jgi:hypothetical protein